VPVGEVLDEIGRQSGAEIVGRPADGQEISADFEAVPVAEALHRLLGSQNFALVYGDGRLKSVKLLGMGGAVVVRAPPSAIDDETPPEETGANILDTPVTLLTGSRLARVLGKRSAPLREVLEVGLGDDDAAVRSETVRVALKTVEASHKTHLATAQAVGGMDDQSLGALLRDTAGPYAREVAGLIAKETKIPSLRSKANVFLTTPGE